MKVRLTLALILSPLLLAAAGCSGEALKTWSELAALRAALIREYGHQDINVVVQNGDGATEPLVYRDPSAAQGSYIFQYAFQDGGPPEPAEFEQALRCWKRPQGCDPGD